MRTRAPLCAVALIAALVLVLAQPGVSSAQQWTDEQQEVIDHIKSCWDAWVEALAHETPDHFYDNCAIDERSHFWWTGHGAPANELEVRRNWKVIREVDDDWVDLRPVYVDVFGDVAIVHFYGYWRANTPNGPTVTEHKRTEVFQRRVNGWVLIGAQGTPATPADAEPYSW